MHYEFPDDKKIRVIVNTDAKNEADDQYAIVHAVLTPAFALHGVIPAHFGTGKSAHSLRDSHDETMLLLDLMDLRDRVHVADGGEHALPDERTPVDSPGARLIIEQALRDDPRPLHVAFYGPLTDMASALLLEPAIESRNVVVIWIGGGPWPLGGREYNLSNDVGAANVIMRSRLAVWQIPQNVYRRMPASYAELFDKVYPCGRIGRYLVEQLVEHNADTRPSAMPYRSLGDSPCVGVMMYPDCGAWSWRPAPEFEPTMHYRHTGGNRPIRVYEDIDARFIHEDFFAKLKRFARERGEYDGGAEVRTSIAGTRWRGVLIAESLHNDRGIWDLVTVTGRSGQRLEREGSRGEFTFCRVEVPDENVDSLLRKVADRLRSPGWYFHVERDRVIKVAYPGRVMEMRADAPGTIRAAREYGIAIGIHPEQLRFERFMDNPFDQ